MSGVVDPGSSFLLDMRELKDPADAGGKGLGLATLLRAGLPVPPVWVVPEGALQRLLAELDLVDLQARIEEALPGAEWQPLARQLRWSILRAGLPSWLSGPVEDLLAKLQSDGGQTLAVRSSATCEDLPGASFAGLFQTFLDVGSKEELAAAIRSCWSSLWSPSALSYRSTGQGQAAGAPSMAVLLQRFVRGSVAGTATADGAGVKVESVWGLGPSLMSGLVAPDRYRLDKQGRLVEKSPGKKGVQATASAGNIVWKTLQGEAQDATSLEDAAAEEIGRLALKVQGIMSGPVEVEWVREGSMFWIVQARSAPDAVESAEGPELGRGKGLSGIPAAPGIRTGRVRFADTLESLDDVGPDDVVVSRYASPELAANFRGAVWVTEMGGASGHGVTLARERQLPMITGVLNARRLLSEGDLVRVNATKGWIEPVED